MTWVLPLSGIEGHWLHENDDRGIWRLQIGEILASLRGFDIEIVKDSEERLGL